MADNDKQGGSGAARTTKAMTDTGTAMGKSAADAAGSMARTAADATARMGQAVADFQRNAFGAAMPGLGGGGGAAAAGEGMPGMAEFTRFFSEMKMPAMPDMEALLSAHRRNLESITNANRVAFEGAQAVAKRHMEIVQQSVSDLTDGMRRIASPESPQAKAAQQAEMLKTSYERAVANMQELSDLIQRANSEALSVLHKRFAEAMDEVRSLAEKSGQGAPPG